MLTSYAHFLLTAHHFAYDPSPDASTHSWAYCKPNSIRSSNQGTQPFPDQSSKWTYLDVWFSRFFNLLMLTSYDHLLSSKPTAPPTNFPTQSPVPCTLAKIDQSCSTGSDCCSGFCTGGNPRNRVCYSNTPTTPAPVAPSTPAPVSPPTPQPAGGCTAKNGICSANSACCSGNCKNNGRCA